MDFMPYNAPIFHPDMINHSNGQSPPNYQQYMDQQHRAYAMPRRSNSMTDMSQMARTHHADKNDAKPRLSKGEVEILERQFQEQHKPSSNTKRQLAERMNVDIARINNWFQNRRAKAKHEKKQVEFGLREAGAHAYSEPSSPERFNPASFLDGHFQSPQSQLVSFPSENVVPSGVVPFHPQYENPTAASMDSLQRTMMEAEAAITRGEFDSEFSDQCSDDQFGGPLPFDSYPATDRAQFPLTNSHTLEGAFEYNGEMFAEPLLTQPIMLQEPQAPQGFGCYVTMSEDQHAIVEASMPTFPSQLLGNRVDQDLTPRPFQVQDFGEGEVNNGFQSPPSSVESRFKSPPPPADIAARRSKPRPAAIGTSALRDKTSSGPKTANNTEVVKRMHGSPSSTMRRVASASGLNVLAGRIQKSSQLPPRSPLKRNFSAGANGPIEHNLHIKMPMRNRSWLSKPRGPPTPRSPRELQELIAQAESLVHDGMYQQDGQTPQDHNTPCSSQSESDGGYIFDRVAPGCFTANGLISNMVSPPETPANPNGVMHWASYDVPDDALLTPGFASFTADGMMQMPQPQYISPLTASQPPTPAFGGHFNGFPFAHHSPVFEIAPSADPGASEYCFPDGGLPFMIAPAKSSPDQPREKTYTFNNATQKDFESS